MATENNLQCCFEKIIRKNHTITEDIVYKQTYFTQEVAIIGALAAVKDLIQPSDNWRFMKLYKHKPLDLTVKAVVWDNREKFSSLFSEEELEICKDRLTEYHYFK